MAGTKANKVPMLILGRSRFDGGDVALDGGLEDLLALAMKRSK